jgi:hypothetical protein
MPGTLADAKHCIMVEFLVQFVVGDEKMQDAAGRSMK